MRERTWCLLICVGWIVGWVAFAAGLVGTVFQPVVVSATTPIKMAVLLFIPTFFAYAAGRLWNE